MLPFIIVGGVIVASWVGTRTAAVTLLGSEVLHGRRAKREADRSYRVDDNPVRESERMARDKEMMKKGIPPVGDELNFIELSEELLPEWQRGRAGKYLLREREFNDLMLALRFEQLQQGSGAHHQEFLDFCTRHNVDMHELSEMVTYKWNYDFEWAKRVSEERLQDSRWRAMARKNGIDLGDKSRPTPS